VRVFKPSYTDRNGKSRKLSSWYVGFIDHRDRERKLPGTSDKAATQELGRRAEKLVSLRRLNLPNDPELTAWISGLDRATRNRLAGFGLIDAQTAGCFKRLMCSKCDSSGQVKRQAECECDGEHLSVYRKFMLSQGGSEENVRLVTARLRNIIKGCKFEIFADINAVKVSGYLASCRDGKQQMSIQTSNFYLAMFKAFCRYLETEQKLGASPVESLSGQNVQLDRRHDRRDLTPEELSLLLSTTLTRPTKFNLTGEARAMLYRTAMESGLRRKELGALRIRHFVLDGDAPSVSLEAVKSKNRKQTHLPLRAEFVAELRQWFSKLPRATETLLWPKLTRRTSDMLKADLEAAGIAYVDDAGLFADFHSLRHSFVSLLVAGDIHPKLTQTLARHSSFSTTMQRYAHTRSKAEREALKALPCLPSMFHKQPAEFSQPTLESPVDGEDQGVMSSGMSSNGAFECDSVPLGAIHEGSKGDSKKAEDPAFLREKREKQGLFSGERGIRTPGTACAVRRFSKPVLSATQPSLRSSNKLS